MRIRLARPDDEDAWDDFVSRHSAGDPLNRFRWKRILEESYRSRTWFFLATARDGSLRAVLPIYGTKDLRGRMVLHSLKHGLAGVDTTSQMALLEHVSAFARVRGYRLESVSTGFPPLVGGESSFRASDKKTFLLDLESDDDRTWKSLPSKTRNMIRKSMKSFSDTESGVRSLRSFYEVYATNMLAKGIPIHTFGHFRAIVRHFDGQFDLIVARDRGVVVSGVLVLYGSGRAAYPFQSSLPQYRQLAPNHVVIWEAMRRCIARGIKTLDMGESSEDSAVFRFKAHFGGHVQTVHYYSPRTHRSADPAVPDRRMGLRRMVRSAISLSSGVFQRLPRPLQIQIATFLKRRSRLT